MNAIMIPNLDLKQYVTTAEFAAMVGCSTETIKKYCQEGRIEADKIADRWLIHRSQAKTFKQQQRPRGRPPRNS
jgi:excisionase family DNA binding protein